MRSLIYLLRCRACGSKFGRFPTLRDAVQWAYYRDRPVGKGGARCPSCDEFAVLVLGPVADGGEAAA